jgi:hypothetical protein
MCRGEILEVRGVGVLLGMGVARGVSGWSW